MTVAELIQRLQEMPQSAQVVMPLDEGGSLPIVRVGLGHELDPWGFDLYMDDVAVSGFNYDWFIGKDGRR